MDVRNYLRAKRRWLVPLVIVPLLAAGAVVLLLIGNPPTNTGTVLIQVPASDNRSDSQIGLYAAKLEQSIQLPEVRDSAVTGSGIAPGTLSGLDVARVGQSDQVILTVSSTDSPEKTILVARALAQLAIIRVVEQSTDDPQRAIDAAGAALGAAQTELVDFQQRFGIVGGVGNGSVEAQLDVLPPDQRQQANLLTARVDAARSQLGDAQKSLSTFSIRMDEARSGSQILESDVVTVSPVRPAAEGAALAALVAFLVVLGISLAPDLLRRQQSTGAGGATAVASDDEPPATGAPAPVAEGAPKPRATPYFPAAEPGHPVPAQKDLAEQRHGTRQAFAPIAGRQVHDHGNSSEDTARLVPARPDLRR